MGTSRAQDAWLAPQTRKTNRNARVLVTLLVLSGTSNAQKSLKLACRVPPKNLNTKNGWLRSFGIENTKSLKFASCACAWNNSPGYAGFVRKLENIDEADK